ncbi:PREDICTED: uncharacterized protein C20orf202 homolog [Elephantulus edwardii]|uniref:uncharacterized protein C20orf202 homolog n=1 Tax=Elephantulus edwardii TaxID=28737 RepID=UPI0003F0B1AB|nr:PREDICTED: uncharacterized protein C20orf202 homolog [Elephantulus edwardii]
MENSVRKIVGSQAGHASGDTQRQSTVDQGKFILYPQSRGEPQKGGGEKSKFHQAHIKVSVKVSVKKTEMKATEESSANLGQTLEWLRKELSEMQIQDQRLLLTLKHLHCILEELRADSAHWEDSRSSGGPSPVRARAGSEGRGQRPPSLRGSAQLLRGEDSRRSSLP